MQSPQNDASVRPFGGLYLRTQDQTRFLGWSSRGWGKLHSTAAKPVQNLADWLRLAHAQLDSPACGEELAPPASEHDAQHSPRELRKLEFVCNRRMIGLLIR